MNIKGDSDVGANATEQIPQQVLSYAVQDPSPNVVVWCRLVAIAMLGMGIERFAELVGYFVMVQRIAARPDYFTALPLIAVCLVWPLLAWYCWSRAPKLAVRLSDDLASSTPTETEGRVIPNQILVVAVLALGLYQFSEAVPTLTSILINHTRTVHNLSQLPWQEMTVPLVRLAPRRAADLR